jgi:uncharacterized protein YheU (UPF0270 family)
MNIPWTELSTETLRAVIEEFVSRDGTDYGQDEVPFDTKVNEIYRLLKARKVGIVFDVETESCDIREIQGASVNNSSAQSSSFTTKRVGTKLP